MDDITSLDRQIDQLYEYKPIPEHEVKALCDKVSIQLTNPPAFIQVRSIWADFVLSEDYSTR